MKTRINLFKLTGYLLILMAIIAGFSMGYAYPKMNIDNQPFGAQNNLVENLPLYKAMLLGIIAIILLDIWVSVAIYNMYKGTIRKLAIISAFLRILYSIIYMVAVYYIAKNLFTEDNSSESIVQNYQSFQRIWSVGLILFGIHLVSFGKLIKSQKSAPTLLWILTIIGGVSYILVHSLKVLYPQWVGLNNILEPLLVLPMALGELGIAVWFIIKGGKTITRKY